LIVFEVLTFVVIDLEIDTFGAMNMLMRMQMFVCINTFSSSMDLGVFLADNTEIATLLSWLNMDFTFHLSKFS